MSPASSLACAPTHQEQCSTPDFDLEQTWKKGLKKGLRLDQKKGLFHFKCCGCSGDGSDLALIWQNLLFCYLCWTFLQTVSLINDIVFFPNLFLSYTVFKFLTQLPSYIKCR